MTISKEGLIAGSPQSLNDLVDRVQAEIDAGVGVPADDSVSTAKIQDEAVTVGKLSASVQASLEALTVSEDTPVNAVAAQGTLTILGVVIDGETFTIGDDVYEFCGDAAQSLTDGSDFAVDITSYMIASSGTLTVDTQPTSGDTMKIGSKTFIFVPDGTANADTEISIGTDLASAKLNIVAAINGTDGVNTAHTLVSASAFDTNDCTITALVAGTAGDAIVTEETFTAGTNVFASGTLGSGADCSAANAVTALVSAVTANDTMGVSATDGAGNTVVLTADTKGTAGNAIAISEVMAHGEVDAAKLGTTKAGVDGTVGLKNQIHRDDSYLYVCIADNTVADDNWRRISLGSSY